ncbi:hypothetical protein [Winogradskyella aurantia]|uniref:Uncharacterized protein n=1 Tax=Winogradskyella aurantia TaxID=1915063 RepID=A0A265V0K1_9FLAO|nr:hypothetical protein [Winogradskyella aurantia]OZV71098.1 hypothetical protein CA834_03005 [Winogradskyella aurantia]
MKQGLILLFFLIFFSTTFAQNGSVVNSSAEKDKIFGTEKPQVKKTTISSELKAKVLKINRKKSNEIISVKAYRKSLQIKVKTVKLC